MTTQFYFYISIITISLICVSACKAFPQNKRNNTTAQIDSLIKEKNARTPVQQKIASQLLQAIKEYQGKKMAEGVNLEPANVNADEKGNLLVDIKAEVSDELLNKIQKLGGKIIFPSKQYHTIRAQVNLLKVETIAGYSDVQFIEPAAQAINNNIIRPGNKNVEVPVSDPGSFKVRTKD